MKKIFTFFIFLFCFKVYTSEAQDIHFTQYYASPLSLNPSNTGLYKGNWRFMSNYRRQWASIGPPFSTFSAGYDKQFYVRNENFSGGFLFINDKSGIIGLTANKIYISGSYHKKIEKHTFSFGVQGGYTIKSINPDATFPEQFDMETGYFNSSLNSGENFTNEKTGYFDLNVGTNWGAKLGKFYPQIGISLFHLTQPNETFYGKDNPLPIRKAFHTSVKYNLNKQVFLYPNLLIMTHNNVSEIVSGGNIGYNFPNHTAISTVFVGGIVRDGFNRNTDAIGVIVGMMYKKFEIGFSYDFNTSELEGATQNKGGFEISLIYTDLIPVLDKICVPCERF